MIKHTIWIYSKITMKNNKFQFIEPKPKKFDENKLLDINHDELINYINGFDIVSISQVAEHFFPAPLSYRTYLMSPSRRSAGFKPEKFMKTAQIVEPALKTIEIALKNLIQQKQISGIIKSLPHSSGLFYINLDRELSGKFLEKQLGYIEKQIDQLMDRNNNFIQIESELIQIKEKADSLPSPSDKSNIISMIANLVETLKIKEKIVKKETFEEHLKQIKELIKNNNFIEAKNSIEGLKSEVNDAQLLSDIETETDNLLLTIGKREKEYYNNIPISKEELNTIKEIEEMIGKRIPLIKKIKDPWEEFNERMGSPGIGIEFGAKVENNTIVYLHLKECGLKEIPSSIDKLKSLRRLILSFNHLKDLPEEIGNLKELEGLYIENIGTQRTPILSNELFSKEIKYKEKKCDHCLETLPESIGGFVNLKKLALSGNNLVNLPASFGKLKRLESLNLNSNQFETLPEIFRELKSLKILSIESNMLTLLPESIGDLKSLEELNLISNQIEALPESFGGLKNLEKLDLRGNKLSSLPSSFGKLKKLNFLDLGKNKFKSIPGEIWPLNSLEKLDIEDNPYEGDSEILLKEYSERDNYGSYNRFIKQRDISVIRDFCRKIVAISIFISHAVVEYEKYMITEFSEFLEQQTEVFQAYFCEQDLIGNIDDFMNQTIPLCQILIFFATRKSINSTDCRHELELARKLNIQIIPVKGDDVDWEDLDTLNLNREFGFDFRVLSFNEFCHRIYEYIKEYKRRINLFNR